MSGDTVAASVLAGYALGLCGLALLRALRSPVGWQVWLLYCANQLYCRLMLGWKANRRCPFLDAPAAIIIANHTSPADPLLIWAGVSNMRPIEFMTASEYFGKPGLEFILSSTRAIPVARERGAQAADRGAADRGLP
jgi:1-acyl-sn-glycerol-3-phosphate acyltransferase